MRPGRRVTENSERRAIFHKEALEHAEKTCADFAKSDSLLIISALRYGGVCLIGVGVPLIRHRGNIV